MKRQSLALLAVLTLLAGVAPGQERKGLEIANELFPLKVGHRWVYVGNDGKERVTITVEKQEPVKRRVKNKEGEKTEQIETFFLRLTSGDKSLLEQVFVGEDGIYR